MVGLNPVVKNLRISSLLLKLECGGISAHWLRFSSSSRTKLEVCHNMESELLCNY